MTWLVIDGSMDAHRAALSRRGLAVQNGGRPSFAPKSCGGLYHTDLHPGPRQETVTWPPCAALWQPQGSHPHVTLPGPQR